MQVANQCQHTVFKGFYQIFLLTAIFFMVLSITPAHSQGLPQSTFNGQQFIEAIQSGSISITDATSFIQSQTNVNLNQAQTFIQEIQNFSPGAAGQIVQGLVNGNLNLGINLSEMGNIQGIIENLNLGNINLPTAQQMLGNLNLGIDPAQISAISGLFQGIQNGNLNLASATSALSQLGVNINTAQLQNITGTLQNLMSGNINVQTVNSLLQGIGAGQIPPQLAQAVSGLQQLQQLSQISSLPQLAQALGSSSIINSLTQSLNLGASVAQVTQALGAVTSAISQIQAAPQQIAAAVVNQLQQAAPGLVAALGGPQALTGALAGLIGGGLTPPTPASSEGEAAPGCGANCPTCSDCVPRIFENHRTIRDHTITEFEKHRIWIVNDFFLENFLPAIQLMTNQLTTTGIQQVQAIGAFFDAKHQLETQRLFQTLVAEAHKDYHPSEGMCVIGTNTRSLASSERKSNLAQVAFATRMLDRQLLSADGLSVSAKTSDRKSRVKMFVEKFCNKADGGGEFATLCEGSTPDPDQINMDVNYTATVENKLTLKVDFSKDDTVGLTHDEENLFALSANLFGNEVLASISDTVLADTSNNPLALADWYLDLRAVAAKRSVAQNSFAAITAMKAEGDKEVAPYLKSILKEAGVNSADIHDRLGDNPSYFAQMEVLTKDLYQNPNFYSNLYDKPVNIERKGAALQAIELMQDRDLYKSLLRSEAVLATLVETLLREEHDQISSELGNLPANGEKYK